MSDNLVKFYPASRNIGFLNIMHAEGYLGKNNTL